MSAFGDLLIDLECEINLGELSFRDIAIKYEVPFDFVETVATQLVGKEYDDTIY